MKLTEYQKKEIKRIITSVELGKDCLMDEKACDLYLTCADCASERTIEFLEKDNEIIK